MSPFSRIASAKLEALDQTMAIVEFKLDGTIITANRNFLNAVGYTLSEIKRRHHSMFVDPAYGASAEYRDFWSALNRGEHKLAEAKRYGKGGRAVWFDASYNPIKGPDGEPISIIKFATDISRGKVECTDKRSVGKVDGCADLTIDGLIFTDSVTWQLTDLGRQVDGFLRSIDVVA